MNLVNWTEYDISILESSSSTNYQIETNYNARYIENFKEKMEVIKRYNDSEWSNDNKHQVCFAQFYPLYTEAVWVSLACDAVLNNLYFICEYRTGVAFFNHYAKDSLQCNKGYVYGVYMCWKVVKQYAITERLSTKELEALQDHLSGWSYGHRSRNVVGSLRMGELQYCLKTKSFLFQRTKHFLESTDCGNTTQTYTLISRHIYRHTVICNTNSQHICDQNTCILHTYVCDGISDCFDKSDEANCTVPLTAFTRHSNSSLVLINTGCADLYFECVSGECVPLAQQCDQHAHCLDSSDEVNCPVFEVAYKIRYNSLTKVSCHFL